MSFYYLDHAVTGHHLFREDLNYPRYIDGFSGKFFNPDNQELTNFRGLLDHLNCNELDYSFINYRTFRLNGILNDFFRVRSESVHNITTFRDIQSLSLLSVDN